MTGLMAGRSFAEPVSCVQYFYGEGCPHCAQINQYLEDLKLKYPKIQIQKFEIYENRTNALILTDYFSKYSVQSSELVVPIVFIGDKYLAGSKDIESLLEDELNKQPNVICGSVTTGEDVVSKEEEYTKISLFTLVGAALVDSINPCAIAVLLILLSALIVTGGKKRALRAGLAFTTSIYISYLLFGLGLVSALKITGLSFWFHQFAGVFAILVGILNLKDYFWYGWGGFVIEIPRQWRPSVKKMLEKVTTPIGAFSIGFVVSLFELPCTGGPYIFILGLLAEKVTETAAIPLLLFYNVFFILPLIVITFLVYKGFTTVEKTTTWKERNIRILHLVAGIVMIVLGIIVVFDFI
jgi:cytochrome c biogenesis protein CcdA/glutaredoxin